MIDPAWERILTRAYLADPNGTDQDLRQALQLDSVIPNSGLFLAYIKHDYECGRLQEIYEAATGFRIYRCRVQSEDTKRDAPLTFGGAMMELLR